MFFLSVDGDETMETVVAILGVGGHDKNNASSDGDGHRGGDSGHDVTVFPLHVTLRVLVTLLAHILCSETFQ